MGRVTTATKICNNLLLVMWVFGAFVLLAPLDLVTSFGLAILTTEYRIWIGPVTLLAFIGWSWNVCLSPLFYAIKRSRDADDVSLSDEEASKKPKVNVIGPFLGLHEKEGIRIVISLPHMASKTPTCTLVDEAGNKTTLNPPEQVGTEFVAFVFEATSLPAGQKYKYEFHLDGNDLNLEGGLTVEDCWFTAPGDFAETDSFLLMSCHNPFEIAQGCAADGWALWPKLHDILAKDPSIRFMVLGGDQVYNDDVEKFSIDRLKTNPNGERPAIVQRFTRQYQLFWENLYYRRVMARVPSLAIWDDHDITDGWGGRPGSYKLGRNTFKDEWQAYFDIARLAFQSYQMARNPKTTISPTKALTYYYDFGPNRIYMLDLRTERNANKCKVMDSDHEKALLDSINTCPSSITRLFVLSPVVPFRTNIGVDRRLSEISRGLFKATKWFKDRPAAQRILENSWAYFAGGTLLSMVLTHWSIWHVTTTILFLALMVLSGIIVAILRSKELPNLSDDLDDALSSDANKSTLVRLLRALFDWQTDNRRAIILSGDIHLAGISEIIECRNDHTATIPQIVSSPVSYQPMPKAVEGFTTTTSEIVLADNGAERLYARNIFYTSKRNFVQVIPERIDRPQINSSVHFYFEGFQYPLAFHTDYLPDPHS